jgi:hypothetical protein
MQLKPIIILVVIFLVLATVSVAGCPGNSSSSQVTPAGRGGSQVTPLRGSGAHPDDPDWVRRGSQNLPIERTISY